MQFAIARRNRNIAVVLYFVSLAALLFASYQDRSMSHNVEIALVGHIAAVILLIAAIRMHAIGEATEAGQNIIAYTFGEQNEVRILVGTACGFINRFQGAAEESVQYLAMKGRDGLIYAAGSALLHEHMRQYVNGLNPGPIRSYGWLTNTGRYIDNGTAWELAVDAGQLQGTNGDAEGVLSPLHLWPQLYQQKTA